jgi:hypothetical protein
MHGKPLEDGFRKLFAAMMPSLSRAGLEQLNYEQDCEESWNPDRRRPRAVFERRHRIFD